MIPPLPCNGEAKFTPVFCHVILQKSFCWFHAFVVVSSHMFFTSSWPILSSMRLCRWQTMIRGHTCIHGVTHLDGCSYWGEERQRERGGCRTWVFIKAIPSWEVKWNGGQTGTVWMKNTFNILSDLIIIFLFNFIN